MYATKRNQLAWLRPFAPLKGAVALPLPFRPQGRIALRQFSGSAQADNAGVLTGWRFWYGEAPSFRYLRFC
jgi:hypothetical protein